MSKAIVSNLYWTKRAKQLSDLRDTLEFACDKKVAQAYAQAAKKLKQLLEATLQEITDNKINGGTVTANDLLTYNRYYDVLNDINKILKELGSQEQQYIGDYLTNLYKTNSDALGQDFNLDPVDESLTKRAINDIWCNDGKKWNDRIWANQRDLEQTLTDGLMQCVTTGRDSRWLSRYIADTYSVGLAKSQRLVRTEMTHIQNQSSLDRYNEAGVTQYKVLEFRDSDTCDICAKQNGQIYLMDSMSEGNNCPPYHPNCRGTIIPIINSSDTD